MIRHMPTERSAFRHSLHGEFASWTYDTEIAAAQLHSTQIGNWQRGGGRGPRPKPVPRPKDKAIKRLSTADLKKDRMQTGVIGSALPFDDMRAWLQQVNGT